MIAVLLQQLQSFSMHVRSADGLSVPYWDRVILFNGA